MKKLFFLLSLLVLGTLACKQGSDNPPEEIQELSERDSLFKEVMRIHDAVMPKMSDINRTKKGLNNYAENNPAINDATKTIISQQIKNLDVAEEAMFDWMRDFVPPKSNDPDSTVIVYLAKEKIRIAEVSEKMLESLQNGNQMLSKLNKNN